MATGDWTLPTNFQMDMFKHATPVDALYDEFRKVMFEVGQRLAKLEEFHDHNPVQQLLASQAKVIELQDAEIVRLKSLLNEVTGPREG